MNKRSCLLQSNIEIPSNYQQYFYRLRYFLLYFQIIYNISILILFFRLMIRKQGDYLICQQPISPASQQIFDNKNQKNQFYTQGSLNDKLILIRSQIQQLKKQKAARLKYNQSDESIFKKLKNIKKQLKPAIQIELKTPDYLFKLVTRVQQLENKVGKSELYNQTVFKKGNLVDRIKVLQTKLNKLAEMSNQVIVKNITQYANFADEKQQQFKHLFVYEQYMNTQGLMQEYKSVRTYLQNLKTLHQEGTSIATNLVKINNMHNQILQKGDASQKQYERLYNYLKQEFKKVDLQIAEIEKI